MATKPIGIILIVGSAIVWAGSFFPINTKLYSQSDWQAQLAVVKADPNGWSTSNITFILGAIITTIGIWGYSQHIKEKVGVWNWVGLVAFLLGAVLFAWFAYQRMVSPESYILPDGEKPTLLLTDMWIMTLSVIAYGLVFKEAGYPGWLSWGALVLGGLFIVFQITIKDMVPMFHYIVTLALGIFLL